VLAIARAVLIPLLVALSLALPAVASARDGGGDVRVGGSCGSGASSSLRVKAGSHGIEVRFRIRQRSGSSRWRVSLVHEGRVAWRGHRTAHGSSHSFELRRTIRDLPGADRITARGVSPGGITCTATAVLRG
jgi:hypothetical protein